MLPKDNAVNHHFQHIACTFLASMIVFIYLQNTLSGMEHRKWISEDVTTAFFFICGTLSFIFWLLWLLRTCSDKWELFDTTYRALVLISIILGASLGRTYALS